MTSLSSLRFVLALAGASLLPLSALPAKAEVAGPYLAARSADIASDFREASHWLGLALEHDPANVTLLESLVVALTGEGEVARAVPVAERLAGLGEAAPITTTVIIAGKFAAQDYAALLSDLPAAQIGPGNLVNQLLLGWAHIGAGSMSEGIAAFDALNKAAGMELFGLYHKALALAMAGDFEGAAELMADEKNALFSTRRGTFARIEVLSQLDRFDEAKGLLDAGFGDRTDPEIATLRARLDKREALPFETVRTAQDGAAEVFHILAGLMQGEAPDSETLIQSRLSEYLRPDHTDATLLTASVLENLGRYELAVEAYDRIPAANPSYLAAQTGRVTALYQSDRKAEAVAGMTELVKAYPKYLSVHVGLGDLLRREERYGEAAAAYSRAIELLGRPEPAHWALYYSRGIAWEQAKEFGKAEPDFRKALELNPGQPEVLNYLGYSLLDRNMKIEEAIGMIEEAVRKRPRDGYIIDSLAWGLFLTGRYEEAVQHMETASLLMPVDPIVTDHLGDVYWAVGRHSEARFQWRRALSFEPTEKDANRIRRKLEVGLDQVLVEEKLPTLDARRVKK
ncbi:tetratricopeptide repeat protein [Falsigemmobacter intermedius]|uniref:tetratricopeptide repeat protein n=1 Tax=Falsigemmobacter intermedius TaxID=1553448 RepID=UPI001F500D6D|nr:tetratricopeptide repeat protein [Falsigemmobacter intermedius]